MLTVWAIEGIPEIAAGDDLADIIGSRATGLRDGDILAVTSKIVSKAEGRFVRATDREQAITDETVRVVATRAHPGGVTRIVENRLGMVAAAAGVDSSNTPFGTVLLLPVDPDASALALRTALEARLGVRLGVIITDTLGRAWREGQTDVAIGSSGVRVLDDLRGSADSQGRRLDVTVPAAGDEIASAADLVKRKSDGLPVAVVRGLAHLLDPDAAGARSLIRPAAMDMFRLGTDEAWEQGFEAGTAAANPDGETAGRSAPTTEWVVVVPVKGTVAAKSRFGPSDNSALAIAMAADTVAAAMATDSVADVLVVTSAEASGIFDELGAIVLVEETTAGLDSALRLGLVTATRMAEPGRGIAVLLGDLPALTPVELGTALGAARGHALAMVPDSAGDGTVLITAAAGATHAPAFGASSNVRHLAAGYEPLEFPGEWGLRNDVDSPEGLRLLEARLGAHTAGWLANR